MDIFGLMENFSKEHLYPEFIYGIVWDLSGIQKRLDLLLYNCVPHVKIAIELRIGQCQVDIVNNGHCSS